MPIKPKEGAVVRTKFSIVIAGCAIAASAWGCSSSSPSPICVMLSSNVGGCIERVDNIESLNIVSTDPSDLRAEYLAGYVQGNLQANSILQTRDNLWDTAYLIDPSHSFPKQISPSAAEISVMRQTLLQNYQYTTNFIKSLSAGKAQNGLRRLMFRLLGIYHGSTVPAPAALDFSGNWLPELSYFLDSELTLGYATNQLTFMDIYFINAFGDVFGALPVDSGIEPGAARNERCSAFLKKYQGDIAIAHNAWFTFLDKSSAISLYVNGMYEAFNMLTPGLIASQSDFGYSSNGIMYTGIAFGATVPIDGKIDGLWGVWQAGLAEQFASSLDEFYQLMTITADAMSGTSTGGWLVVDTKTNAIATLELSQQSFVFIKSNSRGSYDVSTTPAGRSTEYDTQMIDPNYIIAINYPASTQVRQDLQTVDSRPARRQQFLNPSVGIATVKDVETAKSLITYTDPNEPLSIYGRWDLGWGTSPKPKTIPDGSVDAKVMLASMTSFMTSMNGTLDPQSQSTGMWMKYGTAVINGDPFIWSKSQWSGQKLRGVPDRVEGSFQLLKRYTK